MRTDAPCWVEIDVENLRTNVSTLKDLSRDEPFMAVIKADAYGHGAMAVARLCTRFGVTHFGVATVGEGAMLRRGGIVGAIYVLSPFLPEHAPTIAREGLIPMVSSRGQWDALVAAGAPEAMLKVDTGMGRSGASLEEAKSLWEASSAAGRPRICGIATHLSSADEPTFEPSATQIRVLEEFVDALPENGGGPALWLSYANSAGLLRFGERRLAFRALHRVGLLVYGIEPYRGAFANLALAPILSFKARVALIRELPAGASIGYGRTATTARRSTIATISAGFADGFPRALSNRGRVIVRGSYAPVIGRVSMDQCQVDVTDIPSARLGDIVTIIGRDGSAEQSALDLAEAIGTTPHEITCAIGSRAPRVYTEEP